MVLTLSAIREAIAITRKQLRNLEALADTTAAMTKGGPLPSRTKAATGPAVTGSKATLELVVTILKEAGEAVHVEDLLGKLRERGSTIKSVATLRSYLRDDARFTKNTRAYWSLVNPGE